VIRKEQNVQRNVCHLNCKTYSQTEGASGSNKEGKTNVNFFCEAVDSVSLGVNNEYDVQVEMLTYLQIKKEWNTYAWTDPKKGFRAY